MNECEREEWVRRGKGTWGAPERDMRAGCRRAMIVVAATRCSQCLAETRFSAAGAVVDRSRSRALEWAGTGMLGEQWKVDSEQRT
jgi:hypothetical protein